jgi:hypothetical protein
MARSSHMFKGRPSAAGQIRSRIKAGGEGFWAPADFGSLPPAAVVQSLSRLAKEGFIKRAGKGIYYRPRETAFGESVPGRSALAEHSIKHKLHPAGINAANILGFTTQNPGRLDFATTGSSSPKSLSGSHFYTRRSLAREPLSTEEGALLEFLRMRAAFSELSPEETARRTVKLLSDRRLFRKIAESAASEPPRVRALLGAIGQEAKQPKSVLGPLRASLNPLSHFDFGPLRVLKHAKEWRAK